MLWIGVRISWLIVARKSVLARASASACSRARRASVTSWKVTTMPTNLRLTSSISCAVIEYQRSPMQVSTSPASPRSFTASRSKPARSANLRFASGP